MVGPIRKIRRATVDNCATLAFTATEYEELENKLEKQKTWIITSFFYTSPANRISNKLQFDFHSLITALETFVSYFEYGSRHELDRAFFDVGKAQRDVPAYVADKYCDFRRRGVSWFPLSGLSSGLGSDCAITVGKNLRSAELYCGYGGGECSIGAARIRIATERDLEFICTLMRKEPPISRSRVKSWTWEHRIMAWGVHNGAVK